MLDFKDKESEVSTEDEKAYKVLSRIIDIISKGAEIKKTFSDQDYVIFEISKADPGIIIGKHGHSLDAIQYLVNMIVNKQKDRASQKLYIIDIDGYRKRREESLKKYAREKAEIVKRKGEPVVLYFMNSIERRLVHMALKEDLEVTTYSEGKEPYRRIVVTPTQNSEGYNW